MNDLGREYRDRNEREKIRRDKENADWEKANKLNIDDFSAKVTGFTNFDDIGRDYSQTAMNDYIDSYKNAEDALKRGDLSAKSKYEMDMQRTKSSFSKIKDFIDAVGQRYNDYMKMFQEGRMSGVDFNILVYMIVFYSIFETYQYYHNPFLHSFHTLLNMLDK